MKLRQSLLCLLVIAPAAMGCSDISNAPPNSGGAGMGGVSAGGASASSGTASIAGSGGAAGAASGGGSSGGLSGGASSTSGSNAGGSSGAAGQSGGTAGAGGQPVIDAGPIKHHLMVIEYPGRLVEISPDGQKLWEHQTPSLTVMFNVLPNGHIFYPHGGAARGAQEIDKAHQVVWNYDSPSGELLGGERLANGNSLLGEGGPPKAVELDAGKSVVSSIDITTTETTAHTQVRHVHRLPNGNVLAALESEGVAREFDGKGSTVWEYKGVPGMHEAIRLANGNTLLSGGGSKRVLEVTSAGQIVWEFNDQDSPELGLAFAASVQVLKNGDLLICNWVGGNGGPGVHAFQVTRDKKIVWKLDDHQLLKSVTTVTALDD